AKFPITISKVTTNQTRDDAGLGASKADYPDSKTITAKVSEKLSQTLRRVTVGAIRGGKNPSLIFRFLSLFPVQLVQVHKEYSA
ncbi:hypothetical protein, partial [Enterococcus faecalis]|uniref:hypothetical protein n=1 Tax=Enterococcus faecalis TaxID=1351 RepID=UPI003984B54A